MHMATVVEMTVIDIEFADQLILFGVGKCGCRSVPAYRNGRG
jgi:hypothetical protein